MTVVTVENLNRRGIKMHSKTYQTLQKLNWEGHSCSRTSGILTVQQIHVYLYEITIINKT